MDKAVEEPMSKYDGLSDEEKVRLAIDCVARTVPIPTALEGFLKQTPGLHEAVTAPGNKPNVSSSK